MRLSARTAGAYAAAARLGLIKLSAAGSSALVHVPRSAPSFTPARLLGGAAVGALTGGYLAPEDRTGTGTLYGAALGALGAGTGHALSPLLQDARSIRKSNAIPAMGTALGTLSGIGATQALINKDVADTSENPYRY
jgi:hypothetical protein